MRADWTLFVALLLLLYTEINSNCLFPEYLQTPLPDGTTRSWYTETRYKTTLDTWESQIEVTVRGNEMVVKSRFHGSCFQAGEKVSCFKKEYRYKRYCLRKESDNKYRVQHQDDGNPMYTCMQFVPRNKNVIQVKTAIPGETNDGHLCDDDSLQRQEWPWISPVQEEWSPCPIIGGFDFKTFLNDRKQKLCRKVWRPSRIESECIIGEGLEFLFPDRTCSPFKNGKSPIMQCWASWVENGYVFLIAGEAGYLPQFTFRLPNAQDLLRKWTNPEQQRVKKEHLVHLYFNPVCPLNDHGAPPSDVHHVQLKVTRTASGICVDEHSNCAQYAAEGRCVSALHNYARFCKRSCGVCGLVPSDRSECRFPAESRGPWVLYETNRVENITVGYGQVSFSKAGKFICKSKHWAKPQYKVMSVFRNGCHPRYSCIQMEKEQDHTLRYKLSRSNIADKSFRLCKFQNDPPPLNGLFHSDKRKILYPRSRIIPNTCGLRGLVHITGTFPDKQTCSGTLSDLDPINCDYTSHLTLTWNSCPHANRSIEVYPCLAYINVGDGQSLLIIREGYEETAKNFCWRVETYPERMSYKPWRRAILLNKTQCGPEDFHQRPEKLPGVRLTLNMASDKPERKCDNIGPSAGPAYSATHGKERTKTERDSNAKLHGQAEHRAATDGSYGSRPAVDLVGYYLTLTISCLIYQRIT